MAWQVNGWTAMPWWGHKHFRRYWPLCAGNSPITGDFPSQRTVTWTFFNELVTLATINDAMPHDLQIARFMGPTWGPPGSCRPQMGPMLASSIPHVICTRYPMPFLLLLFYFLNGIMWCIYLYSSWWRQRKEYFPGYWPFVRGFHRSQMGSPHKGH